MMNYFSLTALVLSCLTGLARGQFGVVRTVNHTIAATATPIACTSFPASLSVDSTSAAALSYHVYAFNVPAETTSTIVVENVANTSAFSPFLRLFEITPIDGTYIRVGPSLSHTTITSVLTPGTYFALVTNLNDMEIGSAYDIDFFLAELNCGAGVVGAPGITEIACSDFIVEASNPNVTNAALGWSFATVAQEASADYYHVYKFDLTVETKIEIDIDGIADTTLTDSWVVLFDDQGNYVANNTDSNVDPGDGALDDADFNSQISALVLPPGTYYAIVCDEEFRPMTQSYEIHISTETHPCSPGVNGDPHIVTWGGQMFDFHGECDLVLLSSPGFDNGVGMDIYVRTKIQTGTFWSYIESVVIRIGDDTFEMMGGLQDTWFWVNGEPNKEKVEFGQKGAVTAKLGDYSVRMLQKGTKQRKVEIRRFKKDVILIKSFEDIVRIDVIPTVADFEGSLGLIGTFPLGKRVARDGVTVMDDDIEFGKHWQVMASEPKLFHNFNGVQAPQACAMPTVTTSSRRLGEGMSREEAEKACAGVHDKQWKRACVADVLATGNKGVAGAYDNDGAGAY